MAIKLIMPKLGLNMVEGELTQWLKKEGDLVTKGEIIYIVETDKVTNEVEAPEDGILAKIFVKEGEVVPIRKVVGILSKPGERVDLVEISEGEMNSSNTDNLKKPSEKQSRSSATSVAINTVFASPLVKRMASEKGIDLALIKGSGPGGRIIVEDLEKAVITDNKKIGVEEISGKIVPLTSIRKTISERMILSSTTMAMVTINSELDVTPIVAYRERFGAMGKSKEEIPSINSLLISLTAQALKKFPFMNASFEEKGIRLYEAINIGLAVDSVDGLMVIVVKNSDKKSYEEIHREVTELVNRLQNRKSSPTDLQGSTFTISNLGMYGVDSFNPIINPPEAGILGIGRFKKVPSSNLNLDSSKVVATFSLTFDHRVIDGAPAARLLQYLQDLILSLE